MKRLLLPSEKKKFLRETASDAFNYYYKQFGCDDIEIRGSDREPVFAYGKTYPVCIEGSGHHRGSFALNIELYLSSDGMFVRAPVCLYGVTEKFHLVWNTDKAKTKEQIWGFILAAIQSILTNKPMKRWNLK